MKLKDKKIRYINRNKNIRRSSTQIANEMKINTMYVSYIFINIFLSANKIRKISNKMLINV